MRPSVAALYRAFEAAYDARGDVNPVKLRESVACYGVDVVAEQHMTPVIAELLERMAARRAAAG